MSKIFHQSDEVTPLRRNHADQTYPIRPDRRHGHETIYEEFLGMTAVVDGEQLLGVISDGDLRRLLELRGKDALDLAAGECMTRNPRTIKGNEFAATALALMEEKKITALAVVDEEGRRLEGIIHLHDLWGTEMM